jgi:hypothetical protein
LGGRAGDFCVGGAGWSCGRNCRRALVGLAGNQRTWTGIWNIARSIGSVCRVTLGGCFEHASAIDDSVANDFACPCLGSRPGMGRVQRNFRGDVAPPRAAVRPVSNTDAYSGWCRLARITVRNGPPDCNSGGETKVKSRPERKNSLAIIAILDFRHSRSMLPPPIQRLRIDCDLQPFQILEGN